MVQYQDNFLLLYPFLLLAAVMVFSIYKKRFAFSVGAVIGFGLALLGLTFMLVGA